MAADVSCVTGPVLAGTLDTPAQHASDEALGWTRGFAARRFALGDPAASPLFPFAPGEFGVGANFAVRTRAARTVGGFDELLGGGSPTGGGEDIEFWVRLVAAGHTLSYEPAAWLWHHHRDSDAALRAQLAGYATGLGGYLAAVACHSGPAPARPPPGARGAPPRRAPAAAAAARGRRRAAGRRTGVIAPRRRDRAARSPTSAPGADPTSRR